MAYNLGNEKAGVAGVDEALPVFRPVPEDGWCANWCFSLLKARCYVGYWNELAGFGWLLASATSGASGLVTVTGSQKRFPRGRLGRRPAVWGF